jgi:DNA-binding NarL/FixJ family response regulator
MENDRLPEKIRVMFVDDHVLMRMGLTFALDSQPDIHVVGEAEDGAEAVAAYRRCSPDVVILDLRMPKMNGMETIAHLRREFPEARILVLTNYSSGDEIEAALKAGALGFVPKDTPLAELLEAIRQVSQGHQHVPREVSGRLASRIATQLSPREIEILRAIGRGLSNKEIASLLDLTESTIKGHVTNLLTKLRVADRTQAVISGIKRGLIQLE